MKKYIQTTLVVFCLLLFSINLSAQYVYRSEKLLPPIQVNNTLEVYDPETDSIDINNLFYIYTQSLVYAEIDYDTSVFDDSYDSVEISIEITYFNKAGVAIDTVYTDLMIKHLNGNALNSVTRDYYMRNGVNKVRVEVLEIKVDGITKNNAPANVLINNELHLDRVISFYPPPDPTEDSLVNVGYSNNELEVNWNNLFDSGAYYYDLEWTFVDKYNLDGTYYNFKNNASRISTKESSYNIPLLYPEGTLVYRMRPVGRDTAYPYNIIFGQWSCPDTGNIDSININFYYNITGLEAIDTSKNWQGMINFAEEGKRNDVIKYFDGSNRERQTVARRYDPLAVRSVIQENVYDYLGRPAVNILPVPDLDDPLSLNYREKFNRDTDTNKYSWENFNISIIDSSCAPMYSAMDTMSGASRYYSPNNQKINQYPYLPDAEGYPFSLTEFSNDNTGRISRQGGVGATLRLSDEEINHDTKYFYGIPSQNQLDRLFGTEVGNAKHYKRNSVIDPNGQISVSYLDPKGRTIATALAGSPDSNNNLDSLPNSKIDRTSVYDFIDTVNVTAVNGSIEISNSIMITNPGEQKLFYAIIPELFTDSCIDFCYACTYDLEIRITDLCGAIIYNIKDTIGQYSAQHLPCNNNGTIYPFGTDSIFVNFEKAGTYNITKILSVHIDDREDYLKHFIDSNTCIIPLDTLINQHLANINDSICEPFDCIKCRQELQTAIDSGWVTTDNEIAVMEKECRYLCDTITICDMLYESMLIDISPYGQYASLESNMDDVSDGAERLSIFNIDEDVRYFNKIYSDTSLDYVEYDGSLSLFDFENVKQDIVNEQLAFADSVVIDGKVYVRPNYLNPERFVSEFRTSWADTLVKLHPEYKWYLQCKGLEPTILYTDDMMKTDFSKNALDSGYINPLDNYSGNLGFIASNPDNKDPIYLTSYNNSAEISLYRAQIIDPNNLSPSYYSIWDLLVSNATDLAMADIRLCMNAFTQRDWYFFRAKYIQLKNQIINESFTPDSLNNLNDNKINWCAIPYNNCDGNSGWFEYDCGCIPSQYNPNHFFKCFNKQRRFHLVLPAATSEYLDGDTSDFDTENLTTAPNSLQVAVNNNSKILCESSCEALVDSLFLKLDSCLLNGVDHADLEILRTNLLEICTGGCDAQKPFGNVSSPTPSSGGYYTFEEAFDGIIGKENYTESCNPLMVNAPMITYPNVVPLDTCSCNKYMVAFNDYMTTDSLKGLYCSFADYAQIALGELQPNTAYLLHKCVNKYSMLYFKNIINPELLDNIYSSYVEGKYYTSKQLESPEIMVNYNLGCHCLDCYEYKKYLDGFYQHYGHITFSSDTTRYELITKYLNRYAGYYFTVDEVMNFNTDCDTSGYLATNIDSCGCDKIFEVKYYEDNPSAEDYFNCTYNRDIDFYNLRCYCKSEFPNRYNYWLEQFEDEQMRHVADSIVEAQCNTYPVPRNIPSVPSYFTCDSLDCKRLSELNNEYLQVKTSYNSFFDYYASVYEDTITSEEFNNLIYDCCSATENYNDNKKDVFIYWFNKIIKDNGGLYNNLEDTIDISTYVEFVPLISNCGCQKAKMVIHYDLLAGKVMNIGFEFLSTCASPNDSCYYSNNIFLCTSSDCYINMCFEREDDITLNKLKISDFSLDEIISSKNCNCCNYTVNDDCNPEPCYTCTIIGRSSLKKNKTVYIRSADINKPFSYSFIDRAKIFILGRFHILHTTPIINRITAEEWYVKDIYTSFLGDCFGFGCPEVQKITSYNGPTLCFTPAILPIPSDSVDCDSMLVINATQDAYDEYNSQVEQQTNDFTGKYNKKCMNAWEQFYLKVKENEYHYTLYYYDQAGNLIKTVPPAGVKLVDLDISGDSIADYRSNPYANSPVSPNHEQISNYRYNHLNQLVRQHTPDGGLSYFWYDNLGRIVASQNEKQKSLNDSLYSYTVYDPLGRVIEVGEVSANDTLTNAIAANRNDFFEWLNDNAERRQITRTFYDKQFDIFDTVVLVQNNLRNRVASVIYVENDSLGSIEYAAWLDSLVYDSSFYNSAIHYSYDIHGNVERLIYDIPWLTRHDYPTIKQRYKTTEYEYDLISGKVNKVKYQEGKQDCFYHKYEYDGDNRLVSAYTSRNGWVWDEDAKYEYYLHGPLLRTKIGQHKVQGIDYAYTLQGWLKGVNSSSMLNTQDMGQDGSSGIYANVVRDVFGYSIDYYNDSLRGVFDYLPINRNAIVFLANRGSSNLNDTTRNLYNGNISYLTTSIPSPLGLDMQNQNISPVPMVRNFKYDKLNRISRQDIANFDSTNTWGNKKLNYSANYSYDSNGNLLSLNRNDNQPLIMDSLAYNYYTSASDYYSGQHINRLQQVADRANTTTYPLDFEGASNYSYDKIGNLASDSGEEIDSMVWSTYGKLRKVIRTENSQKPDLEFWYDPMGNRLCKIVKPRDENGATNQNKWTFTWYIRDAQGNIMATYLETHENETTFASLQMQELPMYGSSRLGVHSDVDSLSRIRYTSSSFDNDGFYRDTVRYEHVPITAQDTNKYEYIPLYKQYEFSNHLGNVLATISAKPILHDSSGVVNYRTADVLSVNDFYPFGASLPDRSWSAQGTGYRFAFNGKEKDDEGMGGGGSTYDYGFRIYNGQIGRFLSVDPITKKYPELTPYQFASNCPIVAIDLDGLEAFVVTELVGYAETPIVKVTVDNDLRFGIIYNHGNFKSTTTETVGLYKNRYSGVVSPITIGRYSFNSNTPQPQTSQNLSNSAVKDFNNELDNIRINSASNIGKVERETQSFTDNISIAGEDFTINGQQTFESRVVGYNVNNINVNIIASNTTSSYIQNLQSNLKQAGFSVSLISQNTAGNIVVNDPNNPNGISMQMTYNVDYDKTVENVTQKAETITNNQTGQTVKNPN